jgi:hypothetical protein
MKKIKILLLGILVIALFSCDSDDDGVYNELSNTSWQYEKITETSVLGFNKVETETYILLMNYNDEITLNYFYKNNISSDHDKNELTKGTFTYKHPELKFKTNEGVTTIYTMNATKTSLTDSEGKVFIKG